MVHNHAACIYARGDIDAGKEEENSTPKHPLQNNAFVKLQKELQHRYREVRVKQSPTIHPSMSPPPPAAVCLFVCCNLSTSSIDQGASKRVSCAGKQTTV